MDEFDSQGVPHVRISQAALLHNLEIIRRQLRPGVKVCAILKANAYGHEASLLAGMLAPAGGPPRVDAFAVADLDEAAALPRSSVPVMIFRPVEQAYVGCQRERIEQAVRAGWTLTVCSAAAAGDVGRIAMALERRAKVQVMIDTGMTRMDAVPAQLESILQTIDAHPSLHLTALCTHFASSEDADNPYNAEQLKILTQSIARLGGNRRLPPLHACNSGGIFFHTEAHLDMVRPGLSLYGIDPTLRPHIGRALRPILKWVSPILMIKEIEVGQSVGYNQTWRAARPSRIGLVPVGYADGYLRGFSNRAAMMVAHRPAPVVGRVSMDVTAIDLTDIPEAQGGDEVTLLDNDPMSPASAYTLARLADTIPYEIFCRIGSRMPRVAVDVVDSVTESALETHSNDF